MQKLRKPKSIIFLCFPYCILLSLIVVQQFYVAIFGLVSRVDKALLVFSRHGDLEAAAQNYPDVLVEELLWVLICESDLPLPLNLGSELFIPLC